MDIINKIPLLNKPDNIYTSSTFVGNKYFFTLPSLNLIKVFDTSALKSEDIPTVRPYNSITYNHSDNVFYATSYDDTSVIYILNKSLKEINLINLNIPSTYLNAIKNISYYDIDKKILITTFNTVFSITKDGYFIKEELRTPATYKKQTLEEVIANIENGYNYNQVSSIKFTASAYFGKTKYIAYTKNDASYIIKVSEKGNIIDIIFIDDDIYINSIISTNARLELLITKNKLYNYIYITNIKNDLYNILEYFKEDYPLKKISDSTQSIEQILESIADVQKAIADIINIESFKIQKYLKNTENPHDILKINDSVHKTIKELTLLEHLLLQKTELAISLRDNDN